MSKKALALGAILVHAATALNLGVREQLVTATPTITIPYLGERTTSTIWTPCTGQVTLVIQIPIVVPACTATQTTASTSTTASPTGSPTPRPCTLVNPLCAPRGLNIDYYANPFYGYSSGELPSSYYITQNLSPLASSFTNVTFFPQNLNVPTNLPVVYPSRGLPYYVGWTRSTNGGVTVDNNNFTLVYQGLYRAPKTGTYSLCGSADNEIDVFFGDDNAFSCFGGKPSADAKPLVVSRGGMPMPVVCKDVDLNEGRYYPVRIVMGNYQGPSAVDFTIKEPDVAFENRTNNFMGRAYPHECGILR